jgi:hypothetical protein
MPKTATLKGHYSYSSTSKYLGANPIEEVLYDTDLRLVNSKHLQTANMQMPIYKARDWDLMAVIALDIGLFAGGAWSLAKMVWIHRSLIHRWVTGLR